MSITKVVSLKNDDKLVIPCAGKLFRSNISKDDKALCFVINKGYIETVLLDNMMRVLDSLNDIKELVLVGSVEKVSFRNGTIVYRQRIFFKSLKIMLETCKLNGLKVEVLKDFKISISNIVNCADDLKYLERYALNQSSDIDNWLTNSCLIHINNMLLTLNMFSDLGKRINPVLNGKVGYLDRAPLLVSSYSIDNKTSAIFIEKEIMNDNRMYSIKINDDGKLNFGFTTSNLQKDIKEGVFK